MYKLKSFEEWEIIEDTPFGSGRSEKYWIISPDERFKGIFKYPKENTIGKHTGEYWAEKLASEIGKVIGMPMADVDMGYFEKRIGSISYFIPDKDEILIEAVNFIALVYPNYNKDYLIDNEKNTYYSFGMLENSLGNISLFNDFLRTMIFDALIGNGDRHHSNWGILAKMENGKPIIRFSPLYDNGSSLCCLEEINVESILRDEMRFNALVDSKSKSILMDNDGKRLRHTELVRLVKKNYYQETIEFVSQIELTITDEVIDELLSRFDESIINANWKKLIKKFLLRKKELILEIYNEVN